MNRERAIVRLSGESGEDCLAVEEPLEIRLGHGPLANRQRMPLTVTLRTPGHDEELALGLLFCESVIVSKSDVIGFERGREENVLRVDLAPTVTVDTQRLGRTFAATASCGFCGRTMLDAIEVHCEPVRSALSVSPAVIRELPAKLRAAQPAFDRTGGLHAAAIFDAAGTLMSIREDVGRHNAVDKVLGAELQAGRVSLSNRILFLSGRAGFELVQKAASFGVPVVAAVGAPTTLAAELADRMNVTLLGFIRDGRGNCYTHPERLSDYQ